MEEEYLVTALVPSETACLASSPGRMSRTEVWISREEMVDFLLYAASLEASVATRSKISMIGISQIVRCDSKSRPRKLTIDKRVQDRHSTVGDTGIRVDLLENWISDVLVNLAIKNLRR